MTYPSPLSPLTGYNLLEKLGEDPSGEAWKTEKQGQAYAVKLLNPGWESTVFEAFETRKGLEHPNLVKELEIGTYNGRPCLVMEYPDGQPLKKARAAQYRPAEQKRIISELAGALDHLHQQGLVHQSLNPANIFLLPDGTVKILDIGVPPPAEDRSKTRAPGGAFQYAAPEQLAGRAYPKSNIWSFGAIVYEWLTGVHPYPCGNREEMAKKMLVFQADIPHYLNRPIPPSTSMALLRCLRVKPEDRLANFSEVLACLDRDPKETLASAFGRPQRDINRILWHMLFRKADSMNRESVEALAPASRRTAKDIGYRLFQEVIRRTGAWSKVYLWVGRLFLVWIITTLVYFLPIRGIGEILSGNRSEGLLPGETVLLFSTFAVILLTGIIFNIHNRYKFDLERGLLEWSAIVGREDFFTLVNTLSGALARTSEIWFHQSEMKEKEVLLPWLWKSGREQLSHKIIRQLLKGNNRNTTALSFQLYDALAKGNSAMAKAGLQKILEADPRHFAALLQDEIMAGREGRQPVRKADKEQEEAITQPASPEYQSAFVQKIRKDGHLAIPLDQGKMVLYTHYFELHNVENPVSGTEGVLTANYGHIHSYDETGAGIALEGGFSRSGAEEFLEKAGLFPEQYRAIRLGFKNEELLADWLEFLREMAPEARPATLEDMRALGMEMVEDRLKNTKIGGVLARLYELDKRYTSFINKWYGPLILFAGIVLITEVLEGNFSLRFFLFIDGIADKLAFHLAALILGGRQEAFNWLVMHTAAVERAGRIVFWALLLLIGIVVYRMIVRLVRKPGR